jgi:predicted MFS family arabinose efflux permease
VRALPTRWRAIAAYASVAAANQLLWLTFAPITTDVARHYGVSEGAVGWLSEVFPALYVVLAIPAGIALDRAFRPSLLAGAWLTAIGGLVRLGADTFAVALAGQVLIAIAQPLILNAVTKVAATSLPADRRALGIALGSAGIFAGTALALPLGPALGDAASLHPLLITDAVLALAAAALLTGLFHPAAGVRLPRADERSDIRTLWGDRGLRRLVGIAFLGFGLFVALTTWLQALLKPAGVSDTTAGWLLFAMVLAGVAGSAALPPAVVRRGAEPGFLRGAAIVAAAGCVALALAPSHAALAVVPLGVALLAALPVILELTERRAGEASGGATALVWLAGNAGGIVAALLVQALVHHPATAFALLAVLAALVVPLVQEGRAEARTRPA